MRFNQLSAYLVSEFFVPGVGLIFYILIMYFFLFQFFFFHLYFLFYYIFLQYSGGFCYCSSRSQHIAF